MLTAHGQQNSFSTRERMFWKCRSLLDKNVSNLKRTRTPAPTFNWSATQIWWMLHADFLCLNQLSITFAAWGMQLFLLAPNSTIYCKLQMMGRDYRMWLNAIRKQWWNHKIRRSAKVNIATDVHSLNVHPCEKVIGIFFRHKYFAIYFLLFALIFIHDICEVVNIKSTDFCGISIIGYASVTFWKRLLGQNPMSH